MVLKTDFSGLPRWKQVGQRVHSPAGRSFRKPQVRLQYCRVKRERYSFVYVAARSISAHGECARRCLDTSERGAPFKRFRRGLCSPMRDAECSEEMTAKTLTKLRYSHDVVCQKAAQVQVYGC